MNRKISSVLYMLIITLTSTMFQNAHAKCSTEDLSAHEKVCGNYWGAVEYWSRINNANGEPMNDGSQAPTYSSITSPSHPHHYLMEELLENGGFLANRTTHGNYLPDTVSVWGMLAEMGVAIMRYGNEDDRDYYLRQTAKTARYYGSRFFRVVSGQPTQARLINAVTPYLEGETIEVDSNSGKTYHYGPFQDKTDNGQISVVPQFTPTNNPVYPVDSVLPFNFNAAYGYFLAVRNKMSQKSSDPSKRRFAPYEASFSYLIYNYLNSKIYRIRNPHYIAGATSINEKYIPLECPPVEKLVFIAKEETRVIMPCSDRNAITVEETSGQLQPQKLTVWRYDDYKAGGATNNAYPDDYSHAGFAARALAFGANENLVWRWYANNLYYSVANMVNVYGAQFMDFHIPNDSYRLRSSAYKGRFYWDFPYLDVY